MRAFLLILATWALVGTAALAQEPPPPPDAPLSDVGQEARAQRLFDQLRCVVCQHEAIGDSPAGIASDMRRVVREEIAQGRTDDQIRRAMVERYGDYVLFSPPMRGQTWLLWFGPGLILLIAGGVLIARLRSRGKSGREAPLTAQEEARLAEVLGDDTLGQEGAASLPHGGRSAVPE